MTKDPTLAIDVASVPVSVSGMDERFIESLRVRYGSFLSSNSHDDSVELSFSSREETGPDEDITVEKEGDGYRIRSDEFECTLDLSTNRGELGARPNEYVFDSFLRVLYSTLLLHHDGFLVHAAGLEDKGRGYLFPGGSSSGKTTLARRADGFRVLNDELVAVRKMSGRFRIFSTPFRGEFEGALFPADAVLEKIFFLDPDVSSGGSARAGGPVDTIVSLLGNIFFFTRDRESNSRILELVREVSSAVPSHHVDGYVRTTIRDLIDDVG